MLPTPIRSPYVVSGRIEAWSQDFVSLGLNLSQTVRFLRKLIYDKRVIDAGAADELMFARNRYSPN